MRSLKSLCLFLLIPFCLASWGCAEITLGPRTKTVYTVVYPGKPLQILESQRVTGRVLDGNGDAVRQDVGGWIVMPAEHFAALQRAAGIAPTLKQSEVK